MVKNAVNRGMPKKSVKPAKKGSKAHRKKISDGLRLYWKDVRKKKIRRRVRPGGSPETRRERRLPGSRKAKQRRNLYSVVKKRKQSAKRNLRIKWSAAALKEKQRKAKARKSKSKKGKPPKKGKPKGNLLNL